MENNLFKNFVWYKFLSVLCFATSAYHWWTKIRPKTNAHIIILIVFPKMTKLVVVLFSVILGATFFVSLFSPTFCLMHIKLLWNHIFQPFLEAGDFASGELGNLVYGPLRDVGVVGNAVTSISNGVNDVICTAFGPNFLKVLLHSHTCPSGVFLPNIFNSWPKFCEYFTTATPHIQKCLTTSAFTMAVKLKRILNGYERLGECCRSCQVSIYCAKASLVRTKLKLYART